MIAPMEAGIDLYQPIFGHPILEWFSLYGYFILLPLMVIEGRLVGLITSALAGLGYFNIFIIWALLVFAGVISDVFYYSLGRSGSSFMQRFRATRLIAERMKKSAVGNSTTNFFNTQGAGVFFATKAISSLSWPLQIAAGASRMDKKSYYGVNFAADVVWSTLTALIGYFMGYLAQRISIYAIFAIAAALVGIMFYANRRVSKRFSK